MREGARQSQQEDSVSKGTVKRTIRLEPKVFSRQQLNDEIGKAGKGLATAGFLSAKQIILGLNL